LVDVRSCPKPTEILRRSECSEVPETVIIETIGAAVVLSKAGKVTPATLPPIPLRRMADAILFTVGPAPAMP
jgi:hypothetical protein